MVADKSGALFGSGQTPWAVVDIPLNQLDAFRQWSGLGLFSAGVPLDIPGYLEDAGAVADVLKTDVSVEDAHAIPARRVTVHTTGPGERRAFISMLGRHLARTTETVQPLGVSLPSSTPAIPSRISSRPKVKSSSAVSGSGTDSNRPAARSSATAGKRVGSTSWVSSRL